MDGDRELELRGDADEAAPELLWDAALLAPGEAFGEALTVADGEADAPVDGVIDVAGLALVAGEAPPYGVIDPAGDGAAFEEAPAPVL